MRKLFLSKEELEELYIVKDQTLQQVASQYGVSRETIRNWLIKYGIIETKPKGVIPNCIVDGCEKEQYRKEYCSKHYKHILKYGKIRPEREKYRFFKCSFEGCDLPHKAQGYCKKHYMYMRRRNEIMKIQECKRNKKEAISLK